MRNPTIPGLCWVTLLLSETLRVACFHEVVREAPSLRDAPRTGLRSSNATCFSLGASLSLWEKGRGDLRVTCFPEGLQVGKPVQYSGFPTYTV